MDYNKAFFEAQFQSFNERITILDQRLNNLKYKGLKWGQNYKRREIIPEWIKNNIYVFENYEQQGKHYF